MNIEAVARQYTKKEGWLEKKSPSFPFGFQKRFFSIYDDSNVLYLLYDKNPPTKDKKPKGAINISLIQEIITKETSREFSFKFSGRDFVLRAPTLPDKLQWIETIKFLKEYAIGSKEASGEDTAQVNPNEKVGWKFEKLDPTLQRNLRINIEKKNQGEDLTKEIEIKDEQMQKAKGIFSYFEKYSEEAILNHVVQGFLYKKKERFTNKVVQPKQRWFFMFTDFSLTENARQDLGDFELDDLPPFVNPNVIYYYGMSLDESPCEGIIPVKSIVGIKKLDLKVEGDNILKKGIDGIGNTMITAMNKFTEITMLDKIGAHIHRFEFQFQLVTTKDGKEVTHNFYSASLLQIEKWVKSITKVMELYKAREAEKEAQKLAEQKLQLENSQAAANNSNSITTTNDTVASNNATNASADGSDKSQQQQTLQKQLTNQSQKPATNANLDSDDEHPVASGSPSKPGIIDSAGANPSSTAPQTLQTSPQVKRRDQIILQTSLKTKAWSTIRNAWSDRITVLRRQILSVYHDEKELANLEAESYITLKDISQVLAETHKQKLKIIKKNKEEKRFKFKDQQTRDQWFNALIMLTADEDAPIDRLQAIPSINTGNPNPTATTTAPAKERNSTAFANLDDDKRGPSINGETYQPQGTSSSKSSFSSVDNLMFKAYSNSYTSRESTNVATAKSSKGADNNKSCFGSLFSCCIPTRKQGTTPDEGDDDDEQIQDTKTKKLLS